MKKPAVSYLQRALYILFPHLGVRGSHSKTKYSNLIVNGAD